MNFKTFKEQLPNGYWLNDLASLKIAITDFTPNKKEFNIILNELLTNTVKIRIGKTTNWLTLALIINQDKTIKWLTRNGIFKVANFKYNLSFLYNIHEAICINSKILNLSKDNSKYFLSKRAFLSASKDIENIYSNIRKILLKNKKTILKDLLAIAEYYFLHDIERQQHNDPQKIDFYPKEEIADSISFILFTLFNTITVNPNSINMLNEKNIIEDKYSRLIVNACFLKKYTEWETLIDSFGYTCHEENNEIHITSTDPFLEKSIQHGWIYTFIQKTNYYIQSVNFYKEEALSLEKFCEKIYTKLGDEILKRKTEPIERLVLEIPEYQGIFDFLKKDAFFLEEISILSDECREMFMSPNEILDFNIEGELTFRDILYVHRLFNFLRYIFSSYLKKHQENEPWIVFRSLLPVYSKDNLLRILGTVIGKKKAEIYLNLFTWDTKKNVLLDLQYRPIINIANHYIVPINTMCKSNIFRNTLYIIRKRLYDQKDIDPIAEILEKALSRKGFATKTNVKYSHMGFNGDIDLITKVGNTILIIEAKNTLLPGNIFELRTTYDNLIKAGSQLTKIQEAINIPSFAKYISDKVGFTVDNNSNICTTVVLANRLFSGYKINGHSVRSVFELSHFINEGNIIYQDGNIYKLWEGDDLCEKDIENYIINDSFHKLQFEILDEEVVSYPVGKWSFHMHTYIANFETFGKKLKKSFTYSPQKPSIICKHKSSYNKDTSA